MDEGYGRLCNRTILEVFKLLRVYIKIYNYAHYLIFHVYLVILELWSNFICWCQSTQPLDIRLSRSPLNKSLWAM